MASRGSYSHSACYRSRQSRFCFQDAVGHTVGMLEAFCAEVVGDGFVFPETRAARSEILVDPEIRNRCRRGGCRPGVLSNSTLRLEIENAQHHRVSIRTRNLSG